MAAPSIPQLEARLAAIHALVDEPTEREFLRVVGALRKLRTPAALGVLLANVRDTERDMMEIIMQTAESFPRAMYLHAIARELVPLRSRAPYRTSIFVSRIMQSAEDRNALVAALVGAGPEIQAALAALLDVVRDDRPDLGPLFDRVVAALRRRRTL